jgi:hypothetical protein
MSALATAAPGRRLDGDTMRRLAPPLVAAALGLAYVLISPPSEDLPAHLLRAKLFSTQGFGIWNNWWYDGHNIPGYSVLFPPLAAGLTPQIAGALAAVASAAVFEALAVRQFGPAAWVGATWFGAATAVDLYTGRLTFAFGLLPALGTALALQRRRDALALVLAVLTPLASPVAALFAALAGATAVLARRDRRVAAALVVPATLAPVLVLAVLFPEGGSEPYAPSVLWPLLLTGAAALWLSRDRGLRAGIVLYLAGNLLAFALTTPVGSNASRLEPLMAGPLAALLLWPHRRRLLLAVALPLLYIQWQAPVRDVRVAAGDRAATAAYYGPLLRFLHRQPGAPFRIEIPFTLFHGEADEVAPSFPLARGWERQLDIRDNPLFYTGHLSAATYERWLHANGVRYVAVADGPVDYSARAEQALIDRGVPGLRLLWRGADWRVYAVRGATTLATAPGRVSALGPSSVTLQASRPAPSSCACASARTGS